jgi:hypothetical protein
MRTLLQEAAARDGEIRAAFSRAAGLALAGLLAAPAMLGLASAAGYPLRSAVDQAFWAFALAGFGGAGWLAGSRLGIESQRKAALAAAFLPAGLIVAAAVRGLQGLSGREPMLAVAGATLPAFTIAFLLAGALGGRVLGISRIGTRGVLTCAFGGLVGGAFAMLPFAWAWLQYDAPGESYLAMGLAVAGFLGCLIAPFHAVGLALDRARDGRGLART